MASIFRNTILDIDVNDTNIILQNYDEENGDVIPNNIITLSFIHTRTKINTLNLLPSNLLRLKMMLLLHSSNLNNLNNLIKKIEISACSNFDKNVNNLPYHLDELCLCSAYYNKKLNNLPFSIKKLNMFTQKYNKKPFNILDSIEELILNLNIRDVDVNILTNTISELRLLENNIHKIKYIDNLPFNITKLSIELLCFNYQIDNLYCKLKKMTIYSNCFNQKIDNLPLSLLELTLHCSIFNKSFNKTNIHSLFYYCDEKLMRLPSNIIKLHYCSSHSIESNISSNLKILIIGSDYNHLLDFLPEGIEKLYIPYYKNKVNDLPSSIKEIWINKSQENLINKIYSHKTFLLDRQNL